MGIENRLLALKYMFYGRKDVRANSTPDSAMGRIYASYDGGESWQQLDLQGGALPRVSAMVIAQ